MGDPQVSAASLVSSQSAELELVGSSVIPVINRLHDIFAHSRNPSIIDIPQVAIVGCPGSGKSSIVEALVGQEFMPRGSDIRIFRPLVLQLSRIVCSTDAPSGEVQVWGEFFHLPGKKIFDFSEIGQEIQAEADREGVSEKPIRLKIFSPKVFNITLVELPGIARIPIGDQPIDIGDRIKAMIMSIIKHKTCFILVVLAGNNSLAISEEFKISRLVDLDGSRTIAVITKLDIMDKGTDASKFLLKNPIPLKLGYIGVVNRSQHDINLNLSIKEALVEEENFFRQQPVYHCLSHCCGIPQLAKKLNQIFIHHVKAVLPGLRSRINSLLDSTEMEHAAYVDGVESKAGQGVKLSNILTKYCKAFTSTLIEGKQNELPTAELSGMARIHSIFQSIFVKNLEEDDPCADITGTEILVAIQNAGGNETALMSLDVPFKVLVRRPIDRLLFPSLQCAKFVFDELMKMSHLCVKNELPQYPILGGCMIEVIEKFLGEGLQAAETMITHLIKIEMNTISFFFPSYTDALEIAQQQFMASRTEASVSRPKGVQPFTDSERPGSVGASGSNWDLSTVFSASDNRAPSKQSSSYKTYNPSHIVDYLPSMIQLREPPLVLKPSESNSGQETMEVTIMRFLLKSYYDTVRKHVEDIVPKAIMHFLVNNLKRELQNDCFSKHYRQSFFEELLQEPYDVSAKMNTLWEDRYILLEALSELKKMPFEAKGVDSIGLPLVH